MRRKLIEERTVLIEGKPLRQVPLPKSMGRRGIQLVEETQDEYDIDYDNFFEFQKDLDELEASNEQTRRAEIYREGNQFSPPELNIEFLTEENQGSAPIVMEEEEVIEISPIIMDQFEDISSESQFKRCIFTKKNGGQCKRQAPKTGPFCAAHRKK